MAVADPNPLDEVIWAALTGVQRPFSEGDASARRYAADVAPFAAMADRTPASFASLRALIGPGERIALCTPDEVQMPSGFLVLRRDRLDQMVLVPPITSWARRGTEIARLGIGDVPDMRALAVATQPGPFERRTIELGTYLGVRHDGALVAMAGERMRLDGFTEVSAVCVDRNQRGRGLAADLVGALASAILDRSEVPFLHAFSSNDGAIALYRKLGFTLRRRMHLLVLGRGEDG